MYVGKLCAVSAMFTVSFVVDCVLLITVVYIVRRRWFSCKVQWIVWIHSVLYAPWV